MPRPDPTPPVDHEDAALCCRAILDGRFQADSGLFSMPPADTHNLARAYLALADQLAYLGPETVEYGVQTTARTTDGTTYSYATKRFDTRKEANADKRETVRFYRHIPSPDAMRVTVVSRRVRTGPWTEVTP